MKVCFPVAVNEGLKSAVYGHFGSAPIFVMVDTATMVVSEVMNRDLDHAHGGCQPIKAISGQPVDAVVVGGIGGGALNGLTRAGIPVYKASEGSVEKNLMLFAEGSLAKWGPGDTCGNHGHHNGHDHGHGHGHGEGCGCGNH